MLLGPLARRELDGGRAPLTLDAGLLVPHLRGAGCVSVSSELPTTVRCRPACSPEALVVAVADEDGRVVLLRRQQQEQQQEQQLVQQAAWSVHDNAIFDLAWLGRGALVTAAGDRTLKLVDAESGTTLQAFGQHSASTRCVRALNRSPFLFASCCRGDGVMLWDTRSPSLAEARGPGDMPLHAPVRRLANAHRARRRTGNAACLAPSMDDQLLATGGSNDGLIKFWDLRGALAPVASFAAPPWAAPGRSSRPGVASLSFDPSGMRLAANYLHGNVLLFDWLRFRDGGPREHSQVLAGDERRPFKCGTFYVENCFSPDGRFLASGSSDYNAYVWDVEAAGAASGASMPVAVLEGHTAEVSAVSWGAGDPGALATVSDDLTVRLWEADLEAANSARLARGAAPPPRRASPVGLLTPRYRRRRGAAAPHMDPHPQPQEQPQAARRRRARERTLHDYWGAPRAKRAAVDAAGAASACSPRSNPSPRGGS